MDSPVPERHDQLRHFPKWISKLPGQPKISYFDLSSIIHEQIRCLEIAMKLRSINCVARRQSAESQVEKRTTYNPVGVTVRYSRQKLYHDCLDFRLEERVRHIGQEGLEVVFDERHDYEYPTR